MIRALISIRVWAARVALPCAAGGGWGARGARQPHSQPTRHWDREFRHAASCISPFSPNSVSDFPVCNEQVATANGSVVLNHCNIFDCGQYGAVPIQYIIIFECDTDVCDS